jgi:hypothetical protein
VADLVGAGWLRSGLLVSVPQAGLIPLLKPPYFYLGDYSTDTGTEFLVWSRDPAILAMFDATGQQRWVRRYP